MTYPALTPEQREAIEAFAEQNGVNWRETLGDGWRNAAFPGALQEIRNHFGPTWLFDVYAWGWTPNLPLWERQDPDGARWSGAGDPPAIGGRVNCRINGLGLATVTGYFVQGGYLGVTVKLDEPKSWYLKQNGGNVVGHSFGAEIEVLA